MDLQLSAKDRAFQGDVRSFLEEAYTEDIREAARKTTGLRSDVEYAGRWAKKLAKKGWLVHNWPKEFGGPGWGAMEKYIYEYENARIGAPAMPGMGLRMVGPVVMKYGTPEQQAFYLPRIRNHEDVWCQGYSEPGAGSDLASLQTRAISDGDDYIINGSKIWTTGAHVANRMFCLVRTSTQGKPQAGISFVLIDMDTPGITVKPIIMFSGTYDLNQVFFDDVRVPKANRIGEENDGWTVAKYLLEFERGGVAYSPRLKGKIERLYDMAKTERADDGGRLIDDPSFRARLSSLEITTTAAEMTEKRVMSALSQGQNPGPASSMFKLRGSETLQHLSQLAMEALAYYMAPYQPDLLEVGSNEEPIMPEYGMVASFRYFDDRAATIYAGSSEVQRTIIAKRVLHL